VPRVGRRVVTLVLAAHRGGEGFAEITIGLDLDTDATDDDHVVDVVEMDEHVRVGLEIAVLDGPRGTGLEVQVVPDEAAPDRDDMGAATGRHGPDPVALGAGQPLDDVCPVDERPTPARDAVAPGRAV